MILGIDPGLVNVGECLMTEDSGECLLKNVNLFKQGKIKPSAIKMADVLIGYMTGLFFKHPTIHTVVVELQMKKVYHMFVSTVVTISRLHKKQVIAVAPMTIKRHFKIKPMRDHALNKAEAVKKVREISGTTINHNCADAFLLAYYGRDVAS